MSLLVLKVLFAPLLVVASSAAQRRWGQTVGGRLVGLPLTSLPLLFVLALSQGSRFAATAAAAALAGVSAQATLTWAYARVAGRHRPVTTVLAAVVTFAVTAAVLDVLSPGPIVAAGLGIVVLAVLLRHWPSGAAGGIGPAGATGAGPFRHTTAVRMILAGTFSFVVIELAHPLGAHLAGLVTALPVLSLVMFAVTHHDDGAAAAQEFCHGVQRGSFSVVTGLLVLALALPTGRVALGFGAAIAASVLAQVVIGIAGRRPPAEHCAHGNLSGPAALRFRPEE